MSFNKVLFKSYTTKTKCLLSILFFMYIIPSLSQAPAEVRYYPKPKISSIEFLIGPSLTGVIGNEKPSSRFGQTVYSPLLEKTVRYSFGIGVSHHLSNRFQIYARLLYERKGFNRGLDSSFFDSDFKLISKGRVWTESAANDYLTLSILPQFLFGNKNVFNVGIGGYAGSLISSTTEYQGVGSAYSYGSDYNFRKYDFGLSLNAGFSYPIKSRLELTIQLMSNFGLYHVSERFVSFGYDKWYNNSYSLLIGVRLLNEVKSLK